MKEKERVKLLIAGKEFVVNKKKIFRPAQTVPFDQFMSDLIGCSGVEIKDPNLRKVAREVILNSQFQFKKTHTHADFSDYFRLSMKIHMPNFLFWTTLACDNIETFSESFFLRLYDRKYRKRNKMQVGSKTKKFLFSEKFLVGYSLAKIALEDK